MGTLYMTLIAYNTRIPPRLDCHPNKKTHTSITMIRKDLPQ